MRPSLTMDSGPTVMPSNPQPGLLALFTIFSILPFIAVGLRVAARRVAHLPLWWDDYLLFISLAVLTVQYVFLIKAIQNGLGLHEAEVPYQNVRTYLMYTYASEIYYPIVVTLVKSSILCLYIRLFRIKTSFRRTCYVFLVFVVAWGVSIVLVTIFQCSPVRAAWDKTIPDAHCFNLRAFLIGNNVPNILADICIILLPMPLIWKLELSWPRRVGICAIFVVAFIATIISIIRVVANATADLSDVTYGFVPAAIYSTVEANTGIICASVSCLAPLVRLCIHRHPRSSEMDSTKNSGSFAEDEMTFRSRSMKSRAMADNGYGMLPVDGGSPTPTLNSDKTDSVDVAAPGRIIVRSDVYIEREDV